MQALPTIHNDSPEIARIVVDRDHGALDSEEWLALFRQVIDDGYRGAIIDCTDLTTPSSPFMSGLAWGRHFMRQHQGDCYIVNCSDRLQRALEITELERVLLIADDLQTARRELTLILQNNSSQQ